jgi:predicted transcriptional regulator
MGETKPADAFCSTEEEIGVDEQTLAAIDRGIKAADEGRVVPLEEVRRRMQEWQTKSSSRKTLLGQE